AAVASSPNSSLRCSRRAQSTVGKGAAALFNPSSSPSDRRSNGDLGFLSAGVKLCCTFNCNIKRVLVAMDGGTSSKRRVGAPGEGQSSCKRQNATMGMDTLDCPVCFHPLRPPIYQCSVGHFVCSSCRPKLVRNKCHLCSAETTFKRCLGMERLMESVTVACSNANYGCAQKLTYYQREEHEDACPSAPCFCPASSCSFAGPIDALLEHSASQHKWPCTTIKYSEDVKFCLEPGLHFLRIKDREIFLLNVALEPFGHAISVVCIQPKATNSKFKCRMSYGSFLTDYYQISVYKIRSSSLSDGLPKGYNLILPKDEIANNGKVTLLTFSIDDPNPKVKVREPICLKPVRGV
uniref:RING-type E3 ubiquitin transferase n=1 Tax=Aegilops tauschii subsp. strangulata TaxID=200361 RepID=A0A453DS84_AEGTS